MKGIARSFVYWPGIDIEHVAKRCTECARYAHAPTKFHQHHWEYPKEPWERIHIVRRSRRRHNAIYRCRRLQ